MNTSLHTKRILCYGDSNTWGWIPGEMGLKRYKANERWPGILQIELGDEYEVIEEGLGARTVATDDPRPELPNRNGLKSLSSVLETHSPLDLVIVMLGTTDTKEMFGYTSEKISNDMEKLLLGISTAKIVNGIKPKTLLIAPPIVNEQAEFAASLFKGGTEIGKQLIALYKDLASKLDCEFLDSNEFGIVDPNEGVHLTLESHKELGLEVARVISEMKL